MAQKGHPSESLTPERIREAKMAVCTPTETASIWSWNLLVTNTGSNGWLSKASAAGWGWGDSRRLRSNKREITPRRISKRSGTG